MQFWIFWLLFCLDLFLFVFVFVFLFNNPISSSICKFPIRSEIYNCTFKNTNKITIIIIIDIIIIIFTQPYDKFFQMSVKEIVHKWKWWMFLKQVLFHFYSLGCHRLLAVRLRVCLWSRWQWFHRSRIFCSVLPAFWDVLSLVFPFCVCGYSGNYCQRCYGWENWVQGLPRVLCISDWSVIVMLLHLRTNT